MKKLIYLTILAPTMIFGGDLDVMAKIFRREIEIYEEILEMEKKDDRGNEYHEKIGQLRGMNECMWILLRN